MEKLIELLNEYEKSQLNEFELEKYEEWWYCKWNWRIFRGNWENDHELTLYELCSKQYWFIKWLVENDKIDIEKVIDTAKSSVIDTYYYEEAIDDIYIPLLMVLAVKDEPIEYLLSVIK